MTQITFAKNKTKNDILIDTAKEEPLSLEKLTEYIKKGWIVIPKNRKHDFKPVAVGKGTYIKVNANIGISSLKSSLENELKKLDAAVNAGAHSIMDLSVCQDVEYIRTIRNEIIKRSPVMIGTVPIYEATAGIVSKKKDIYSLTKDDFIDVIKRQAEDGVDFMTIHAGVTKDVLNKLSTDKRLGGIVSRGGSIIAEWIKYNNKENPYYEFYDEILEIAYDYDVTISLGDGLRPGAINDGTDRAQIQELIILGELVDRSRDHEVQVMVEGPGHIRLNEVEMNIKLQKKLCHDAPFYILGPVVTDIAPGYDHITAAIGGAVAGMAGADFICYVTPTEHLSLPDIKDVHEGVIAARIAAHSADLALNKGNSIEIDNSMSIARKSLNWKKMAECAIDKEKVLDTIKDYNLEEISQCTMCGEYCALKRNY